MALKENYVDDVLDISKNTKRKYEMDTNADGTISLNDVTEYSINGDSFGAYDINSTNKVVNETQKLVFENLVPYPFYDGRYEDDKISNNGIEYTFLNDGKFKADGLAIANSTVWIFFDKLFKKGTYYLTGCPEGGDNYTTFRLRLAKDGNANTAIGFDTGAGFKFTLNEDTKINLTAQIFNGAEVDNIIFSPMIVPSETRPDEYKPYLQGKVVREELNQRLGGKTLYIMSESDFDPDNEDKENGLYILFDDSGV